jgi:hypothetical protein
VTSSVQLSFWPKGLYRKGPAPTSPSN